MITSSADRHARPSGRRPPFRLAPAAAGLLALLAAACSPSPSPSPSAAASSAPPSPTATAVESASASASSSASASAPASAADCTAADLRATGGPWGGAAGSRGADVVVENAGSSACSLPGAPVVAIADHSGTVIIQSAASVPGGGPSLNPTGTLTFSLLVSNWCDRTVSPPITVKLVMTAGDVVVDGLTMTSLDQLPPCNGPGEPASVRTTDWAQR